MTIYWYTLFLLVWSLLREHNALLLRHLARDLLHELSHRHDNTYLENELVICLKNNVSILKHARRYAYLPRGDCVGFSINYIPFRVRKPITGEIWAKAGTGPRHRKIRTTGKKDTYDAKIVFELPLLNGSIVFHVQCKLHDYYCRGPLPGAGDL